MIMKAHQVVIVGGGTAGITVAAQLKRKQPGLEIALIEPSEAHYYQPAWTLVGAGVFRQEATRRPEGQYIPDDVLWIKEKVTSLDPANNSLTLANGETVAYQYLVMCPGIQIDWDKISGLTEALGKNGVCSNFDYHQCAYTWEVLKNFKGGTAQFTNPNTVIKCGGAPQKIMYLTADYLRKHGLLSKTEIRYTTAGGVIFGIEPFKSSLEGVIRNYGIKVDWRHNLIAIDGPRKEAVYELLEDGKPVGEKRMKFDMIHVTPPMSAPDFIKSSPLAGPNGYMAVDKNSLQSSQFANVFGLGDATNSPNAKTGAAIRKQAPVLVANLLSAIRGKGKTLTYTGYASCPIVTGYGKLILAEFNYENKPTPTFPFDQSKQRLSMYWLKRYFLPWFYWNRMLRGKG